MPSENPLVSIVVLNWNGLADTLACLESLNNLNYSNREIIVVDNGSADGSKEVLAKRNDIILVDLPKNTGFTGGQIAGLAHAKGEYIALVNNDAIVATNWIETLLEPMTDPFVAATGGRAYVWNEEYSAYNTNNPFYSFQVVGLRTGYTQTLQTGSKIVSVNSISGAGVLIRRKVIEKVGYFDNRFFAYYEETDLFARFKRAGYKVLYVPNAHTWHRIASSTKGNPFFYLYQMHRNRFIYAIKNFDHPYVRSFFTLYGREVLFAGIRLLKRHDLEDKARLKAGIWNLFHLPQTLWSRWLIQRTGGKYSESLLKDSCPTVSIIIPCYNYERFVGESIESALNQTQPAREIIVIDDGSSDDSLNKIQQYKDSVRIIAKENSGVVDTKNLGIKEAQGDWIIFLDADDKLEPSYIEECLSSARKNNYDLVYTGMRFFGQRKGIFHSRPYDPWALMKGNFINNSALIRADLLKRVGGYKHSMKAGFEDWELYLTLSKLNIRGHWIDKPLLLYRRHAQSSRDQLAKKQKKIIFNQIYALHPDIFNNRNMLRLRVKHYIRILPDMPSYTWYLLRFGTDKFINRYFVLRKIKGILLLIRKGKKDQIIPKAKKHWKNIRNKNINWRKD